MRFFHYVLAINILVLSCKNKPKNEAAQSQTSSVGPGNVSTGTSDVWPLADEMKMQSAIDQYVKNIGRFINRFQAFDQFSIFACSVHQAPDFLALLREKLQTNENINLNWDIDIYGLQTQNGIYAYARLGDRAREYAKKVYPIVYNNKGQAFTNLSFYIIQPTDAQIAYNLANARDATDSTSLFRVFFANMPSVLKKFRDPNLSSKVTFAFACDPDFLNIK